MNTSLILLTIGGTFVSLGSLVLISLNICPDSELLSCIFKSSDVVSLDSCDKINKLLSEFNSFKDSLDRKTHIDVSTKYNLKETAQYWLYGTATEINWFDKACQDGWDYFKACCNITTAANDSYNGSNEQLTVIAHDCSSEQLKVTVNSQPNYFVWGMGCLLLGCAFYYGLDIYKAIDQYLYNILCMFDYPGFMVEKKSTMTLVPWFYLHVEHNWQHLTDPQDGRLALVHLATYSLNHNCFWLEFNSLPPAWSVKSYANLVLVPGLRWPLNYDHFHYINLFTLS